LCDTVFWLGERIATTRYSCHYIHDLGFDGNGTTTNATAEFRNAELSRFGGLLSRDNAGNGFTFDQVDKFNTSALTSSINGGYGLQFRSSITTAPVF
jgi:hypothetical protein